MARFSRARGRAASTQTAFDYSTKEIDTMTTFRTLALRAGLIAASLAFLVLEAAPRIHV